MRRENLPTSIWTLGVVSMLMDISSEMIHCLLPLFLVTNLGASGLVVGIIDGLAEATALIIRVFSGFLSDYFGKRKPLATLGYALGGASKPLFALATSSGLILAARLIDRIGKGIRSAPRDALIADLSPSELRGAAFGLRQALDTVGAFLGPLLAMALMLAWNNSFRPIFWLATIPGLLAPLVLFFGVKEPASALEPGQRIQISKSLLYELSPAYWQVVAIGGLFTLSRFSEAFLVLLAHKRGIQLAMVPLVMVLMNAVYAIAAFPFGRLADRLSHKSLLSAGIFILLAADLCLALSTSRAMLLLGFILWGLHMGMTQGLLATMIADNAPQQLRGTAFGIFNVVLGFCMLLASLIAGLVWDKVGAEATFYFGAGFCLLSLLSLRILK